MEAKKSLRFLPAALLLWTLILFSGCLSLPGGFAPAPVPSSACGFTNCHGLDLSCGPDIPEACTAIYQLGDRCRQYAYCSATGGTCELVVTDEFVRCKSCIGRCGGADATEIFACEEKC